MNSPNAFGEGCKEGWSPTGRRKGRSLLIRLLVGLREEPHVRIRRSDVFLDGDEELDVTSRLALFHGEMLQNAQFVCRFLLREMPLGQCLASSST